MKTNMKQLLTFESFINESNESDKLAIEINKSMLKIDDSMSYTNFAIAVAKILVDEYGEHNYISFMKVLHDELGMKHTF